MIRAPHACAYTKRTASPGVKAVLRWWLGSGLPAEDRLAPIRLLELGDVDLRHLKHRLRRPFGGVVVALHEHFVELMRKRLPRDTEAVLQPPAHAVLAAALDEGVPVAVDLGLVLAVDHARDRLVESDVGIHTHPHE